MKNLSLIALLCLVSLVAQAQLKVSDNKRYLVTQDGKPFFWLGDTAWELFHRLNREEADRYLKNRVDKGFTVIQAVALAELDGLHSPNPYGEVPLENDDPTKPREAYFQHVDYIVDKAASLGLYIALLPTWGDKLNKSSWGTGPEIFTTSNAKAFGKWMGNRYKNRKNIIWIMGGDRNPRDNSNDVEVWRAMAAGVAEGVGSQNAALMSYHPQPNSLEDAGSAKWFHNDAWLDFNMFQTGHCRENNVWDRVQVAYNKTPVKPVLDGETLYEDHPVCFNAKDLGTSSAYDIRKHAYLDLFAGAFGHTYGAHPVWQMYGPGRQPVNGPHFYWYDALDLPGAAQMTYVRRLMESRPMLDRVPDQSLITNAREAHDRIQATRGKDYIFVYTTQGKDFTVNMGKISGQNLKATWYNPKNGETKEGEQVENKGQKKFTPPSNGYGHDWVLVLDDASKNYPKL
ncbi:glycoside hydrolase family 140 protein [Telluribacter sp. SYSU D00476]|uniref:glycoside hydrolase family 140 protein n=1 Tax=Telluribacter sp. SYSU D00476 TaxID=2811430 RepID=UPI001FF3ECDB|nr:glycoside hydrolase family 140 protein [Telluribacter sp. SYSU D00476]